MVYSGSMDTALQQQAVGIFFAVEMVLPGPITIRLLDGAGSLSFSSKTFVGVDSTYGTLENIQAITDGISDQSPHAVLTINPPGNSAAATLASSSNQGAAVTIWFGVYDVPTGLVVGTPDTIFVGEIDVGKLIAGHGYRRVELDIASVWDRFFDVDEGVQLNNAWHQSIWSGELGLEYVTTTQYQIPWGSDAARPSIIADGQTGSGDNGPFNAWRYIAQRTFL